uniref:Uncharacterized protein n=1 Tax=Panagrolaimus superbus TaxID=310955 RepID=A0A914Z3N6_9BILA
MNSSFEIDAAKEAEIQRQKELIGEMPFKRIVVEKIKDEKQKNNIEQNLMKEKENHKTLYQIYLETPENEKNGDDDNEEEKLVNDNKNDNIKESQESEESEEENDNDNESTVSMIGTVYFVI